jgi:hypothetical protein
MQRLKQVEDENRRLRQIVAEQTLDIQRSKRSSQKSGRPHRPARRGGVAPDARHESAASLSGDRLEYVDVAVSATHERDQPRRARTTPGARGRAGAHRLSAAADLARARGACGESQTRPSDLSGREVAGPSSSPKAPHAGGAYAVAGAGAEPPPRALVDGLHDGHAGGWAQLPDAEHRGRFHAPVRRDRSRPLAPRAPRDARPRSAAHHHRSGRRRSSWTTGRNLSVGRSTAWAYAHGVTLRFIRPGKPIAAGAPPASSSWFRHGLRARGRPAARHRRRTAARRGGGTLVLRARGRTALRRWQRHSRPARSLPRLHGRASRQPLVVARSLH